MWTRGVFQVELGTLQTQVVRWRQILTLVWLLEFGGLHSWHLSTHNS